MDNRYQKAKQVTLIGAVINTCLGIIKIIFGYFGHSQALVADGIHSLSDLITDALVVFAAKMGAKKPDLDHPYGHGRIETVVTAIVAILIILVGLGIAYDGIRHLINQSHWAKPDLAVLITAVIAILAKEIIYRYTLLVANRIHSNLLRANAWHHRSDAFVSIVVLIGVIGAWFGYYYLDAVAAVFVAILIIKMGWQMIWENVKELVDTGVDKTTLEKLEQDIRQIPGVFSVHQLRTRSLAGSVFVDVHIMVAPQISVSEGHYISDLVYSHLINHFDKVTDVTVHIDSEDDEKMALTHMLPNRQQIEMMTNDAWRPLPGYTDINKIVLHYLNQKVEIEVIMPLQVLEQHNISAATLNHNYNEAVSNMPQIAKVKLYFS